MTYKITRNGTAYWCEQLAIERSIFAPSTILDPAFYDLRLSQVSNPPGIREIVLPIERGDSVHIEMLEAG